MKQFIFKFSIFIIIFVFALSAFSIFLKVGQKNYDSTAALKLKIFLEDKSIDPEIIIFGSSVAEGAINPQIISEATGKTAFNAALSGRRIIDWGPVAFSFLDYTKNSKVIILDIFPNTFNETENLYQPHEFYPYLSNKFVKESLAPISSTYEKMANLPFYYLTQLNSKIILNSIVGNRDIILDVSSKISSNYKGFNKIETTYKEGLLSNLIQPEISPRSINLYEELFLKAEKKGIKIVLIGMPVYNKGKKYYNNLDTVYNQGQIWSKKYKNVEFVNFLNDTTIINNQDFFANNTHLNKLGASFLSKKVSYYLTQNKEE